MSAAAAAPATPPALQGGVVRSVLSGDTLIVRPKGVNTPGSESIVHIAGIAAPRMGSRERDDEVSGCTAQRAGATARHKTRSSAEAGQWQSRRRGEGIC